jgi:Endonuclease/Exonuclease/phosphatase family
VLSLNVQGWLTRDASALSQVIKAADFDVLAFSETWAREGADAPELDGFTSVLNLPRSRRQQRGGTRGGIAVYVAERLASSVTHLSTGPQNCYAVLRFDKSVGQEEDAYMFLCYIDIDIDYILVVGHFGLATGSGGKTQSNMHNKSCPKLVTPR